MITKKLSRVALVAFVLAVLLAVSSLAYTVTIESTVDGLEDGVEYTAAQYDFANNAYGEFTALTADTKLTAGVWGIKAGDAEPVALFVQTNETGRTTFWNEEKAAPLGNMDAKTHNYVPGKWTRSADGAFSMITSWDNTTNLASVCIHIEKNLVLAPAKVAKTVTVEEVAYPVYAIDGAEYYLKEEAYYAVADNALYEGEGEAVAVTVDTWTGATPLEGDANHIQESVWWYGFTNEQVFPASVMEGYTTKFTAIVGAFNYNEGYSANDLKPEVTFYTKKVGSDEVNEYTVNATFNAGVLVVPAPEGVADDEFIVAFGIAPYANIPDDFFVNGGTTGANNEARGYFHNYLNRSVDNGITVSAPEFAAPTGITGGTGVVEGLDSTKNYQIAYVTINSDGTGYTIGEWTALNDETNKDLAGLAVVRYCSEDGEIGSYPSDIFYITGDMEARATLSVMGSDGKIVASAGDTFVPGAWKGASCGVYEQPTGGYAVLDQTVGGQVDSQTLWLYQHTEAEANAKLAVHTAYADSVYAPSWIGGKKPAVMQEFIDDFYASAKNKTAAELAAEKAALQAKIAGIMEARNFKYAFTNEQIIPAEELLSFDLALRKRQGSFILKASATIIFKVMDLEGNITDYTWTSAPQVYGDGAHSWAKLPVNAAAILPDDGFVVGMEIHPVGDIDEESLASSDGKYLASGSVSARFVQNQWQAGYHYDSYEIGDPRFPKLKGLVGGYNVISGLEEDGDYQYALYTLNSKGDALVRGEWTDLTEEIPGGLMSIREVLADGFTSPSDMIYVYGDASERANINDIDPATGKVYAKGGTGFVADYWTGSSASTHSTFSTYIVSTLGGGWISTTMVSEVKAAQTALDELKAAETPDATAIAEAEATLLQKKQALSNIVTNNWLYYGFTSDEITDISELKSFAFTTKTRQGIPYNAEYESKVAVYVSDPNGIVKSYEYITPAAKDNTKRTVDFTDATLWTPNLPEEGYVVGIAIDQWYGKTDINAWTYPNTLNTLPSFELLPEDYIVDVPVLPKAEAPEGLYVEDGVIKGLDANVKYQYATIGMNGTGAFIDAPKNVTELTIDNVGLIAIRKAGDGITYGASDVFVVLIPGEGRNNIIHTTTMVGTGGKYKDQEVDVLDQVSVSFNDENRNNPIFNENKWTGMATEKILCLTYGYDPLNLGGTSCPISSAALCKAIDELAALKAAETPDEAAIATAQAAFETAQANFIKATNDIWYSYQYSADEIIAMEDFASMTIKPFVRQAGAVPASGKFQTKFVFKVMKENGEIVDRVAYKDARYAIELGDMLTFKLSDFEETDGYIIGILVYPFGKAIDVTMKRYLPERVISSDIDLTLFDGQYLIKGPAAAPEFDMEAGIGGVKIAVTNAVEGATYAWSLDGKTWTNALEGESVFTALGAEDVVYVKMLPYEHYFESPVTSKAVPEFKATPELVLGEGNLLTAEAGLYEIAKYVFGTDLAYEPLTEKTLTAGVWAVRAIGDETAKTSAPQVIYVEGNAAGTINYSAINGRDFVEGKMVVPSFSTMYRSGASWDVAIAEIHGSLPYKLSERRNYAVRYQFTDEEIIPVTAATDILSAAPAFYHGYLNEGFTSADGQGARTVSTHGQTLARVWVAGASVPYYEIITENSFKDGYNFAISEFLADKEGYITALELYPVWSIYGADNKTELGDDCITALWLTSATPAKWSDYTFKLRFNNQFVENELPEGEAFPTSNGWGSCTYADGTNRFAVSMKKAVPEAPVLKLEKSTITITNYVTNYKYQYSTDGGETWLNATGKTITTTKASCEYLVKVAESSNSYESDAAAIVSNPVVVVGTSLVLDGRIGTKMYFDIDEETIDVSKFTFHATKVNADYAGVEGMESSYKEYGYTSLAASTKTWLSKVTYDEAQDLYYVIFYTPAKDADNLTIQTEVIYYIGTTKVVYGSVDNSFKVTTYIANARALAEAGNEAFVEALPAVNALDNYLTYADAYFGKKTVDEYRTTATVEVETATRTNTALEGVEFYGTSLILEDNVTIRHYFTVNDIDAFVAAGYTSDIAYGTKGDYIYFDITDIPAQELGDMKALNIKTAAGSVVYTINYSAANYMANMMADDDANLVNLVNAMYDYYLAAADYAK